MRESKRRRYLTFYDDEHPIGAQLFGSNPETLAEAAESWRTQASTRRPEPRLPRQACRRLQRRSGCCATCQNRHHIPRHPRSVSIPFTVKFRMGWNDNQIVCVELARIAEAEGLNAVASTPAPASRDTAARPNGNGSPHQAGRPYSVIGNGDIRTPETPRHGGRNACDAVMIGRAAPANPWIFRQIAQYTATAATISPRRRPLPHDPRLLPNAPR